MNNTCRIKGIFAIFVLLHHLYQFSGLIQNQYIGLIFQSMGYLSVSVFFFLSGYGVMESYRKKGDSYIFKFPRKHILPFYVNCVILIAIYTVFQTFVLGQAFDLKTFVLSFIWGSTVIPGGWYLQTILIVYLAIYCIFRFVKTDYRKVYIFAFFLLIYTVFCIITQAALTRYEAIFAVLLGVIWSMKKSHIDKEMQKRYLFYLSSAFGLFCILFLIAHLAIPRFLSVPVKMLSSVVFVWLILLLLMKLPLRLKIMDILGRYFFEIYVTQGIALTLFRSRVIYIENDLLYVVICLLLLVPLAVISHLLFSTINAFMKGKKHGY